MHATDSLSDMLPTNPSIRGQKPSATLTIHELSQALERQGKQVYRVGFGQSPFPVPAPVVEALRANAFRKEYLPVKGLGMLREAVANHHRDIDGISCVAGDVLIGPGSKELMFLLELVCVADVLIPSPSWVSYAPQAQMLGRRVVWIPAPRDYGWRLAAESLDAACSSEPLRPRLLILNYPNNPTGLTYTRDELIALADVARKYRLLILSDEIYGRLHFKGAHVSIARFYPEGTIISSGLSKWCGAGGWRLGTFLVPAGLQELRERIAACASETYTTASAPVQYAAVRAFEGGPVIEAYLAHARRILKALGEFAARRLREAGVLVANPEGGFYLLPDFSAHAESLHRRGIQTGGEMCRRLLEATGVALLPGSEFGRPASEFTARFCFVDFDGEKCLAESMAGAVIDEAFLLKHCAKVTMAADLIAAWIR
jgi:aspartate/methionine/tyrosine aminotransferase